MTQSIAQSEEQFMDPLHFLQHHGQSIWLDYIRRSLLTSGELQELVASNKVQGATSNPAIFQTAIAGSTDYDKALDALEEVHDRDARSLYEELAIADIQAAADILMPVYTRTHRRDGYVSLEVSPYLADDTVETIAEAHRLWQAVARPNLMIKVPATSEGIAAVETLIGSGINVNVTLLFSQAAYEAVADAYITGLERFSAQGGNVSQVASVESFFVSRIDTAIDGLINAQLNRNPDSRLQYRLSIVGEVNHPMQLSLANLQFLPFTSMVIQHVCVEGWAAIVQWGGVRLQDLLRLAQPKSTAQYVYFKSADGYYESWDLASAMHPQTLMAYQKNGQPLPVDNGAPLRLASPVKLGYKQSKWVTQILLTQQLMPQKGYWEDQGYEWFGGL
jgi:transaldolase